MLNRVHAGISPCGEWLKTTHYTNTLDVHCCTCNRYSGTPYLGRYRRNPLPGRFACCRHVIPELARSSSKMASTHVTDFTKDRWFLPASVRAVRRSQCRALAFRSSATWSRRRVQPRHQLETHLDAEERAAMIQNYVDEAQHQCALCHRTSHLVRLTGQSRFQG